jgi:hypothetical protein
VDFPDQLEGVMAIAIGDIEKGWIYRTKNNQERLVLGWDKEGRVVYASRGGNVMNEFKNCHTRSSNQRFAEAVDKKVREVPDVAPFVIANNAQTVVVR